MAWPKTTDYSEAVQNPRLYLGDDELRAGEVAVTPLGLPMLWSGTFADVYKIHCAATGSTWALKCFTREVPDQQTRYRNIAMHLDQARLPFTVDFQYLERGIRVGGAWFPALKMRWVEGLTLNRFVEEHLGQPKNLKMLLDLWLKLAERLRSTETAHADLQHGNVLLVPKTGGQLALRLIDYDGMFVPQLAGGRSGEVGHPAYQHPQRLREGSYSVDVDRFAHLTIYSAVRCLMIGRHDLWQQFNNGDNLLFRETDFQRPGASKVFHALWGIQDANARALVGRLILACLAPLEQTPLLEDVIVHGDVRPLTRERIAAVERVLSSPESKRLEDKPRLMGMPDIQCSDVRQVRGATSPARSSAARPIPLTWDTVERYVRGLDENVDPTMLRNGEQLASMVDREDGLERFAQLVLKMGLAVPRYRHLLEERASIRGCSLCGRCFAFVPSPFLPAVADVKIIGRQSVRSDAITVEYSSGIWSHVKIEGRAIAWDGPEPETSMSRAGALIGAITLTLGPLLILFPFALILGFPVASLLLMFGLASATVVGSIAIFFHPRVSSAVDTAWEVVVPHILRGRQTRRVAAFVAGLANATVGKGNHNRRKPVLEEAISKYRQLVEDVELPCQYLSALYRLAIHDQLHRFGGATGAVRILNQVFHGCVTRLIPLDCLETAADDGALLASLTDEARMVFRYYVCMECYLAGYAVADVMALAQQSRTVGLFLAVAFPVTAELVAYWFATLKVFPSGRQSDGVMTVFDLACREESRPMVEFPDMLAVSHDGKVRICARGIYYHSTLFDLPLRVGMVPVQHFVQTGWTHQRKDGGPDGRYRDNPPLGYWRTTGYTLTVNGVKFSHSRDPSDVAAELREWSDIFFNKIRPTANYGMRHRLLGQLPHPELGRLTACPSCGRRALFREGHVAEEYVSSDTVV